MPKNYRPIRTPFRQRLAELRQGPLIVLVWLLALGAVVVLFGHRMDQIEFIGLAQPLQYEISSPNPSRLTGLNVDLFQQVKAGDVIAQLDDSDLTAKLQTAQAALERIKAEQDAERARLGDKRLATESGWQTDLRRFQAEEEQHRIQALDVKVKLESDRVDEQRLALDLERTRKMVEAEVAPKALLDDIQQNHQRSVKRIEENENLLKQTETATREAQSRSEAFAKQTPGADSLDSRLRPLTEAIKEQEAKLAELEVLRKNFILRAPADGQVTQILCHAGQAVRAGEAIAHLTEQHSQTIVAYVSELESGRIKENTPVELYRVDDPTKVSHSAVLRIGPAIEQLPQRLWRSAQVPEFGRPVMIPAIAALGILPGESVRIKILAPPAHTLKVPMLAFNHPPAP